LDRPRDPAGREARTIAVDRAMDFRIEYRWSAGDTDRKKDLCGRICARQVLIALAYQLTETCDTT
jgi:hypothetical protein